MANIEAFEQHAERYEQWFDRHHAVYESELKAVGHFVNAGDKGLEVGVGTGRFAAPLGIAEGVEPSPRVAEIARGKGINVTNAAGEDLPFEDATFDYVLMVTTICFLDDPLKALMEAYRVLRKGGYIIVGFVDSESPLGKRYLAEKESNVFYRSARFFSADEVLSLLSQAGFRECETVQTIFGILEEIATEQGFCEGHGDGGFVVVRGYKQGH